MKRFQFSLYVYTGLKYVLCVYHWLQKCDALLGDEFPWIGHLGDSGLPL